MLRLDMTFHVILSRERLFAPDRAWDRVRALLPELCGCLCSCPCCFLRPPSALARHWPGPESGAMNYVGLFADQSGHPTLIIGRGLCGLCCLGIARGPRYGTCRFSPRTSAG